MSIAEVHAAIRRAHGPGRTEYLFDPVRAISQDYVDGIIQLTVPRHEYPPSVEGRVVTVNNLRLRITRGRDFNLETPDFKLVEILPDGTLIYGPLRKTIG